MEEVDDLKFDHIKLAGFVRLFENGAETFRRVIG